jgi:hypothetical protein
MSTETENAPSQTSARESRGLPSHRHHAPDSTALKSFVILVVFILGLGSGYLMGKGSMPTGSSSTGSSSENTASSSAGSGSEDEGVAMIHQINPPDGYAIPATFGDVGPQMLAAGAIGLNAFVDLYEQIGNPLTNEQMKILTEAAIRKL